MTKNTKSFFGVSKEPTLATIPEYGSARKELVVPNTFGSSQNAMTHQPEQQFMSSHAYNIITGGYQRKTGQ